MTNRCSSRTIKAEINSEQIADVVENYLIGLADVLTDCCPHLTTDMRDAFCATVLELWNVALQSNEGYETGGIS